MSNKQIPILGVGIMLINPEGQVLLGKRIKSDETITWCFPGGKMDLGETYAQAAVRELHEETDLRVDIARMQAFCVMTNTAALRCNTTMGMTLEIQTEEIQQIKVTEPHIFEVWQWFERDQLPASLFPETEVMLKLWNEQVLPAAWSAYRLKAV